MRVPWGMGFLAITLALMPAPAPAQSLGEAAAREKERREKEGKKPPAKVLTENDLGGRAGTGTVSQPGSSAGSTSPSTTEASPAPSAEGAAKLEPTEEELRAQKETVWRKKREAVQDEINRLTEAVDKLQLLVNDMTVALYGPGRASLINKLETGKQSLAQARQMLADLEEEGRQNRYR